MHRNLLLAVLACLWSSGTGRAAILTYNFSGIVSSGTLTEFGYPFAKAAPFSGHFSYDLAAAPITTTANSAIYDEPFVGGFMVTVGSVTLQADDHWITVFNDQTQPNGSLADAFYITFDTSKMPSSTPPLLVNGAPQSTGLFLFTFYGGSALFQNTSLPTSLRLSDYSFALGFVGQPGNPAQANLLVTQLTAVPEPTTWVMAIGGIAGTLFLRRWFRHTRR